MLESEALGAVQEQDRWAITGLEQLQLDAGDRNDVTSQGTSSQLLRRG